MATTDIDVYKEWLGIPEGPRPPDYYTLLRLPKFEDDQEKVQKNYRKLNSHVRKYATGQYSVRSQELLNELARAMLCLTDRERKREYDESLGREQPADSVSAGRKPLEDVLVDRGIISVAQKKELKAFADARGLSLRDAAVQMKLTDQETATRALAVELGHPFVDLNEMMPDDSVLDRVPRNLVKRNQILPLFVDDDVLLVACVDEPEPELEQEMQLRFGVPMRAAIATPLAINQGIAKYYAPGMRDEAVAEAAGKNQPAKGKGGKEKATKSASGGSARKVPFSQLDAGTQKQRRQVGWIALGWSIVLGVIVDQLLIPTTVMLSWPLPFLAPLILFPIAAVWVFGFYWK